MHLHEIMLHSSRRCLLSRCRVCAGLRFILGRPVSFKTLNLNKDGAREQETGSQLSLTSIDQLQKRHGEKNATLHLRWVWLVNRKDGKLKAGILFHFYRDILLLFLLPFFSTSSLSKACRGGVSASKQIPNSIYTQNTA